MTAVLNRTIKTDQRSFWTDISEGLPRHLLPKNAQGALAERRRQIREVESPSAKVAEPDKFRCSGVPFRQAMSLRLEPHFKFIIGAEESEDRRLRLGICVGDRRGSIHILR